MVRGLQRRRCDQGLPSRALGRSMTIKIVTALHPGRAFKVEAAQSRRDQQGACTGHETKAGKRGHL